MKSLLGLTWCMAACATGCMHEPGVPFYATVHIAVQGAPPAQPQPSASAPVLSNVPDIPSVGSRVSSAQIEHALTGYGAWYEDATYGEVWEPNADVVGAQFAPYGTDGRWVPTDAGWYWQSELPFGWLTFHYGRWVQTTAAWAWVPGAMFAPAWVDWRMGNGWAGWAPLPPVGAPYAAPYAYCEMQYLTYGMVWERVVYGTAGSSIYPLTEPVMPSYGYGGAVYAWGPPATAMPPSARGPLVVQPVETAWRAQFTPRAGTPGQGGTGGPAVAGAHPIGAPGGSTGMGTMTPTATHMPANATAWRPLPGPTGMPSVPAAYLASGPIRHTTTLSAEPLNAASWRNADPVRVSSDPSAIGLGHYRASNTVVIRASVPEPMPSAYEGRSVDVGRSFGSSAYGSGGGYEPASAYAPHPSYGGGYPSSVSQPSYGGAAPPHPSYGGGYPSSVSQPSYEGGAPSRPVSSGYSAPAPSYGAGHPSFSAPAAAPAFHSAGSFGRAGGRR